MVNCKRSILIIEDNERLTDKAIFTIHIQNT